MSWIQNLQNKSREQKIRIIWVTVILIAVILIVLWIFTSRIPEKLPKDASIFQTFGKGVKNIREQYNH
jgi:predicted permease